MGSKKSIDRATAKHQARVARAHGALERARERFTHAEDKLKAAEQRVEKALARAAAELENRAIYAADGANESTSSEVNLLTAAAVAISPPKADRRGRAASTPTPRAAASPRKPTPVSPGRATTKRTSASKMNGATPPAAPRSRPRRPPAAPTKPS